MGPEAQKSRSPGALEPCCSKALGMWCFVTGSTGDNHDGDAHSHFTDEETEAQSRHMTSSGAPQPPAHHAGFLGSSAGWEHPQPAGGRAPQEGKALHLRGCLSGWALLEPVTGPARSQPGEEEGPWACVGCVSPGLTVIRWNPPLSDPDPGTIPRRKAPDPAALLGRKVSPWEFVTGPSPPG